MIHDMNECVIIRTLVVVVEVVVVVVLWDSLIV
jgi:hypothetical protein